MKTTLAVLALCVCATGALAAAPECRVIENANARLSCYDAVYPPKMEKSAVSERDPSRAVNKDPFNDPFSAEDARTSARLKNICRGC
ncbi:type VI secretion protein [Bradyrhizobium sp. 170]|jgi:hypothetical protein|uniref:type VI secretion protein n=1 Tax=Bradyrhizobium sp. 170 TaxID=2782641 RepID=UPI001FFE6615|nr:type VI secretion protein [Bradyrhizobium sp. 170]UPK03620.1 hypothetical protein IVB05_40040 [Bradyrhizobium sp. 170]